MFRIALVFGGIAGGVAIAVMSAGIAVSGGQGLASSQPVGYLVMILALSLIFVGIKQHRDDALGGVITFWRAFGLGLAIAAVAGVAYVIGWEIFLAATGYDFMESYIAATIEAQRATGVGEEDLQAQIAEMETMRRLYANPLFRLPVTFLEIFPVGLLVALVSAALLRNPRLMAKKAA